MNEVKDELVALGLSDQLRAQFDNDTNIICKSTEGLLREVFPYYLADNVVDKDKIENNSSDIMKAMNFFKIADCTIEDVDDIFLYLNEKIQKFLSAAYSIGTNICYGIVGQNGNTSIVLGIDPLSTDSQNAETLKNITQGLLPGITLKDFKCDSKVTENMQYGVIGGVPTVKIKDDIQRFDFAPIVRSLNGKNFTLLVMAKPVNAIRIQDKIGQLIQIKDTCVAISKRNISLQHSTSKNIQESRGNTDGNSEGSNWGVNVNAAPIGMGIGAIIGSIIAPGIGTVIGAGLGSSVGGALAANYGKNSSTNHSESYTKSISEAITAGGTMSLEIQNGFAMELIKYADSAIERMKMGQNTGVWQTAISYSADSEVAINLLQGCLYSEIAKPNSELLPARTFRATAKNLLGDSKSVINNQLLIIPKNFFTKDTTDDLLCSVINTQELSLLCSLPDKNVPGFEMKTGKFYPLVDGTLDLSSNYDNHVNLGHICDCERELENIDFSLANSDLNKHTFVCGITGSGKTNTVKHILSTANKPFLVIECAKKEYRNIVFEKESRNEKIIVYTLGKPEINCVSMNPFYILPGTSPQTHIDYLKDLFNASFSLYGPMPYIIEKCLHNIYLKRGWDLTLGYHPYFINTKNDMDFFDENYIKQQYKKPEHKFIFPTMTDLKNEINYYIKKNMDYKGEVSDNIRTAIVARLESLCVGAKGYMFDTYEMVDFDKLLSQNCVFELEGLADDSDKAFAVGLLVIYITEYRQLYKETQIENTNELQHLLVIEEAHRLLKNISTERSSENMGNPKGKAVEHFTNMIAEMRSYGQGVIIAEQIPSKIAPDVIKNTSNKIIHRIVSCDDQELVANMIGVDKKDSIFLGNQKTGYALCHKEGMRLPVSVKIPQQKNNIVKDDDLRQKNLEKQKALILKSIIRTYLATDIEQHAVRLFNTMLTYDVAQTIQGIKFTVEIAMKMMNLHPIPMIWKDALSNGLVELLSENIVRLMLIGVYSNGVKLPAQLQNEIIEALRNPYMEPVKNLIGSLTMIYRDSDVVNHRVTELAMKYILENSNCEINYHQLVKSYFVTVSPTTVNNIVCILRTRGENHD